MSADWADSMVVNHDANGAFNNGTIDPSAMGFNGAPDNFDFGQMQGTPLPQHMQNGIQRNGSPAGLQQPTFQTTSVVPSKRPHNDTYTNSPRQASRSITPQQPQFPGGFPTANGQPGPNAMQNFGQVNSNNASPSPVMPNQQFNVNGVPAQQRMQTASPSPFSPAATNAGLTMSPAPSDFSAQNDGAANGVPGFPPQGNAFMNGQGAGSPQYHPQMGNMVQQGGQMPQNVVPGSTNMDHSEYQRRLAAMRSAGAARQHAGMVNTPPRPGVPPQQSPNPQLQHLNQQHTQRVQQLTQVLMRPVPPEKFSHHLSAFNQQRNLNFNPNLNVGGVDILPANLYGLIMGWGGSKVVSQRPGGWLQAAQKLQLEPTPINAQGLMGYWSNNLGMFEQYMLQMHHQRLNQLKSQFTMLSTQIVSQQQRQAQAGMQGAQNPAMMHMRRTSGVDPQMHGQMSPQGFPNQAAHLPQMGSMPRPPTQGSMGMPVPPATQARPMPPRPPVTKRSSSSAAAAPTPEQTLKGNEPSVGLVRQLGPQQVDRSDPFVANPFDYFHGKYTEYWGCMAEEAVFLKTSYTLEEARPEHPLISEMGSIDIHNLNMSIKSGITSEVRLALDILWELTRQPFRHDPHDPRRVVYVFPLKDCDDLLDSLVDYAEEQAELLADSAEETSEEMALDSYEDLVRACEQENLDVQDVHATGSKEYELERAAERLVSIVAIMQNLACPDDRMIHAQLIGVWEDNLKLLAEPPVMRFISNVIRNIGTRKNLLRKRSLTLDFYKDTILLMGSVSAYVDLPGKDETQCILQFLLAFGTSTARIPSDSYEPGEIVFSTQEPEQNRYMRFAVDSLAKLLAKDESNRNYFKSLFTSDAPFELLSKTFALAIAPVPDEARLAPHVLQWRQSYLPQGLLAADILTTMIPSDASTLAQAWLYSPDGWASNVVRIIVIMGIENPPMPPPVPGQPGGSMIDYDIHAAIVARSLNVLQQLAEKSKEADADGKKHIKVCRLASKTLLIRALRVDAYMHLMNHMGQDRNPMQIWMRNVLKQLNSLLDIGV